jgi:hypothetical protein
MNVSREYIDNQIEGGRRPKVLRTLLGAAMAELDRLRSLAVSQEVATAVRAFATSDGDLDVQVSELLLDAAEGKDIRRRLGVAAGRDPDELSVRELVDAAVRPGDLVRVGQDPRSGYETEQSSSRRRMERPSRGRRADDVDQDGTTRVGLHPSIVDQRVGVVDMRPRSDRGKVVDLLGDYQVQLGLADQGHLGLVGDMLAEGSSWDEIGRAIGWEPATVRRHVGWQLQALVGDEEAEKPRKTT